MKTIAQQLNIKSFPFEIKNDKGKEIYFEISSGNWYKKEYDSNNNRIYFENSDGYWSKREYDSNNNRIYFEDSTGYIIDNRPKSKEYSMDEIAKALNISVEQLKIKK
jgi:hypothetical protein